MCLLLPCRVCGAAGYRLTRFTAGFQDSSSSSSDVVDLYNSVSGEWSTAQLSVARQSHAATSVGNVAIFAGGLSSNCSFALCDAGFIMLELLCANDAILRHICCCLVVFEVQQVVV